MRVLLDRAFGMKEGSRDEDIPSRKKNILCILKERNSDSRGKGQVPAQQDQAGVASPACSAPCSAVVLPAIPVCI